MLTKVKILGRHGRQSIRRLDRVTLPDTFRGCPELSKVPSALRKELAALCPTGAILPEPFALDMGRCIFCNECAMAAPDAVRFTNDFRMASNVRENLVVTAHGGRDVMFDPGQVRAEVKRYFGRALKLREVCAGGDASTDMELNASMNVNFDFPRYGVEFVASPRHADGIVITGPVTENMSEALSVCYDAVPHPKIIILAGTDAISGGLFAESRAVSRHFLQTHVPDLYVPGNPVHPLTFIDGVLKLIRK